ncbi:helix-turn-helix domain-containing protein [Ideonella sp. YS5]|uniref:helix-turn-helix domain-containing protein n=1 Tax=Ideonella sp. YS5 TaxID=3453714 RepID=UPI003EE866D1
MADLLDCAKSTVEELARQAKLPGLKYGQGWIFPLEAVSNALNEAALARVKSPPAPPTPLAVSFPRPCRQRRALPVLPDLAPSA